MAVSDKRNEIIRDRIATILIFLSIVVFISFVSYQCGYRKAEQKAYFQYKKPIR